MTVPNTPLLRWGLFVVVALLAAVVYVWWIMPLKERQAELAARLEQKRKEWQLLTDRPNASDQTAGKFRVELERVREAVPEEPYRDRLVQDLRMLESVTRLEFSDYNFQTVSTGSGSQSDSRQNDQSAANSPAVPIQLKTSVKGDWSQIQRLLEEIQTLRRLVRIDRIELQADAAPPVKLNADKRVYVCQLTLDAYYAPGLKTYFPDPMPIRVGPEP